MLEEILRAATEPLVVGDIMSLANSIGKFLLGLVLVVVGFLLIVRAVLDFQKGLGGETKDIKAIAWGIGCGILGAIFLYFGADSFVEWFRGLGSSVPKN